MTRAAQSNGRSPATYSLAVKTAAVLLLTVTAFFTAVSGVGIGLYLTANILNTEGGRVSAKSDENGSVFTVYLPKI